MHKFVKMTNWGRVFIFLTDLVFLFYMLIHSASLSTTHVQCPQRSEEVVKFSGSCASPDIGAGDQIWKSHKSFQLLSDLSSHLGNRTTKSQRNLNLPPCFFFWGGGRTAALKTSFKWLGSRMVQLGAGIQDDGSEASFD